MYIGRFVIAGRTAEGEGYLAYRVSSRSFPNRTIAVREDGPPEVLTLPGYTWA